MASEFLHDEATISDIISNITTAKGEYEQNVADLKKLVDEISVSSDWIDESVKGAFELTAKSYVSAYSTFVSAIDTYVKSLQTKSDNIVENEEKFS
jgi:uncharacterized protein YukE